MIVACVLRSGGVYGPEHVWRLAAGVDRYLPEAEFMCLTDMEVPGLPAMELATDWPGWWAKLELFRAGLFNGRVLYLDLDTVIVGDLSEIAGYQGPFAALEDFYRPEITASGVMAWDGRNPPKVYDPADPPTFEGRMDHYLTKRAHAEHLQDLYPGQIVSYKVSCKERVPRGARLVCYHGDPKPWSAPPLVGV